MKNYHISKLILLLLILMSIHSCKLTAQSKPNIYDQYLTQKIEKRDSILFLYTMKAWSDHGGWNMFDDFSRMYKMTNDQVAHFIGAVFYSPDKKKVIVWIGSKMPNASTIEIYNKDEPEVNRLCPLSGDTIYGMLSLIGYRNDENAIWNLYPLENERAVCFDTKEDALSVLEQYYFEKMKVSARDHITQDGAHKGETELKDYSYNLQDSDFWDKCWLWERDTVGSNGLYSFQVEVYRIPYNMEKCIKCGVQYDPPKLNYPDSILKMYQ